jgi:hypothetical protein
VGSGQRQAPLGDGLPRIDGDEETAVWELAALFAPPLLGVFVAFIRHTPSWTMSVGRLLVNVRFLVSLLKRSIRLYLGRFIDPTGFEKPRSRWRQGRF